MTIFVSIFCIGCWLAIGYINLIHNKTDRVEISKFEYGMLLFALLIEIIKDITNL